MADLARRIDPRWRCFYYSPRHSALPINQYHLDAMWAEIETGIPTINGYSGLAPPGWSPLYDADFKEQPDLDRLGEALGEWALFHQMRRREIGWVVNRGRRSRPLAFPRSLRLSGSGLSARSGS